MLATSHHPSDDLIKECPTWDDFSAKVAALATTKAQGDAFERLVQAYLATAPHWAMAGVWMWRDSPASVRERLGLATLGGDEGFDLLAEQNDRQLWAIQCKFRGESDTSVVRADFDSTFALAATCQQLAGVILSHTSARPFQKLDIVAGTRTVVELQLDTWATLSDEAWSAIRGWVSGEPIKLTPRTPRPHQRAAIDAATRHYIDGDNRRGRMVMPCGAGKSLTALWIANALHAQTVIVAVPSLALIRQTLVEWTRELKALMEDASWLCVCSDESVATDGERGDAEEDAFTTSLAAAGIQATTVASEIETFLKVNQYRRRFVFTTYQSAPVLAAAFRRCAATVDFAVLDEAHKTVGARTKHFAALLREDVLRVTRRLAMTATERVVRGDDEDDVLSMDDADSYGDRFYLLSYKDAIAAGIITDYSVLTIAVPESQIALWIANHRYLELAPDVVDDAQTAAAAVALARHFNEHHATRAVSFHRNIDAARRFAALFAHINELGVRPFHVSSLTPTGDRFRTLQTFASTVRSVVTNARCLTEGVDLPALDTVVFVDPRKSHVDIVQAAGRALRRASYKERGYILIPVIVQDDLDLAAGTQESPFRDVIDVVTALATSDERIADELRLTYSAKERIHSARQASIVQWEVTAWVGQQVRVDSLAAAVRLQLWQRIGRLYVRPYEEARAFARNLNLETTAEWSDYCRSGHRPPDIPSSPNTRYRHSGWTSWGDWLGTDHKQDGIYGRKHGWRPFDQARDYIRSLGLASGWRAYCSGGQKPADIPSSPNSVYRDKGWVSWSDWMGVSPKISRGGRSGWRPFPDAREFVRSLNLTSQKSWKEYLRSGQRPPDIPSQPCLVYLGNGWISWADWFGVAENSRSRASSRRQRMLRAGQNAVDGYRSFAAARRFARSLGLTRMGEWTRYRLSGEMPSDIPAFPQKVYKGNGWLSWMDWLGTKTTKGGWPIQRDFASARRFVRALGLVSSEEWRAYCRTGRKPTDIPASPDLVYRGRGWESWGDWLGNDRPRVTRARQWRPFDEARVFARNLGLRSCRDWSEYCSSGGKPIDIPSSPQVAYSTDGWVSWMDWLGYKRTRRKLIT